MMVARHTPGPAYANLQGRKPRDVGRGAASDAMGDLTAVVPECEYNFCDMARTLRMGENAFRHPCNFKELRVVKKGTYYNLCVVCLMAAFVPHRPNSPYTPLAFMAASPIASVRVFETVRDADVVSLRSLRSQRRR